MLLSDGRITRLQRRSLRRKDRLRDLSFLLGLLRSTSLAYANFDYVRPCHSEWSEAESNCEAAPNEVRWNLGRTSLKMTHYIKFVQSSKSGYISTNLSCTSPIFGCGDSPPRSGNAAERSVACSMMTHRGMVCSMMTH